MAYYLEFDGVDDHVSVPQIELTGDFEIVVDVLFNSTQTGAIIGEYTASPNSWIGYPISQNTLMYLSKGFAGRMDLAGVQPEIGVPFQLRYGRRNNTTKFVEILGVTAEETVSDSGGYYISEIGSTNGAYFSNCAILSVKIYNSSGALIHHYDPNFTAETGAPYLVDTVGGNHGTPVGFADFQAAFVEYFDWLTDSVDEPLRDNGLKITSASEQVSLPLIGTYDVTATYDDDSTENFTGSGSLVIDGSTPKFIKSISGTDSVDAVFYDANQDAGTTNLPELLQGKDGTLIGSPAYEPIIPRQVFTVGSTGSDYTDPIVATNAEKATTGTYTSFLLQPEAFNIGAWVISTADFVDGVEFVSDTLATVNVTASINPYAGYFKNIRFEATTASVTFLMSFANQAPANVFFDDCEFVIDSTSTANNTVSVSTGTASEFTFRRCLLLDSETNNAVSIINQSTAAKLNLYDNIIVARNPSNTNANGAVRAMSGSTIEAFNNIVYCANPSFSAFHEDSAGALTGSNNISADASVTNLGLGTQLTDLATGFKDEANSEYQIKQAYADANLVGQGYLGSDIASAFYYTESGGVIASCDFSINNPEFSALLNATLPSVSAEAAFSISAPELSGNLSATLPTPIANASFTIESPTFSADATTIDNPSLSGAFEIPSVTFALNARATLPSPNSVISFEIPSPDLQGAASAIIPVPSGMVEFDVDSPDFLAICLPHCQTRN